MLGSKAKCVNVGWKSLGGNGLEGSGVCPAPVSWGPGGDGPAWEAHSWAKGSPCCSAVLFPSLSKNVPTVSMGLASRVHLQGSWVPAVPRLVAAVPNLMALTGSVIPIAELRGPFWTNFLLGFILRCGDGELCVRGKAALQMLLFTIRQCLKICESLPPPLLCAYRGETFGGVSGGGVLGGGGQQDLPPNQPLLCK